MIAELRRERDSILFRRTNPQNSSKDDHSETVTIELQQPDFVDFEGDEAEEKEEEEEEFLCDEQVDIDEAYQQWQSETHSVETVSSKPSNAPRTIFSIRREEKIRRQQTESYSEQHSTIKNENIPEAPMSNLKQDLVSEYKEEAVLKPLKPDSIQAKLLLISNSVQAVPENKSIPKASEETENESNFSKNRPSRFLQSPTHSVVYRQTSSNVKCANNLKTKYSRARHDRSKSRTPLRTVSVESKEECLSSHKHFDGEKTFENSHSRDEELTNSGFSHCISGKEASLEKYNIASKLKSRHQCVSGYSEVIGLKPTDVSSSSIIPDSKMISSECFTVRGGAGPILQMKSGEFESNHSRNTTQNANLVNANSRSESHQHSGLVQSFNSKPGNVGLLTNNDSLNALPASKEIVNETLVNCSSESKKAAVFKEGKVSLCFSSEQCEFQIPKRKTTVKLKLKASNISPTLKKEPDGSLSKCIGMNEENNLKRTLENSDQERSLIPESKKFKMNINDANINSPVELCVKGTGNSHKNETEVAVHYANVNSVCMNVNNSGEHSVKLLEVENCKEIAKDLEEGEVVDSSPPLKNTSSEGQILYEENTPDYKNNLSIRLSESRSNIVVNEDHNTVTADTDETETEKNDHSWNVGSVTKERHKHNVLSLKMSYHGNSALRQRNAHPLESSKERKHKIKESVRRSIPKWRAQGSRSRQVKDSSRRSCTPVLRRLSSSCERRSPSELFRGDRKVGRIRQVGNSRCEVERSRTVHRREVKSSSQHYVSNGRSHSFRNTESELKNKLRSVCLKVDEKSHGKNTPFEDKLAYEKINKPIRRENNKPSVSGSHSKRDVERKKSKKDVNENSEKLSSEILNKNVDGKEKADSLNFKEYFLLKKNEDTKENEEELNIVSAIKDSCYLSSSDVCKTQPYPNSASKLDTTDTPAVGICEVSSASNDILQNSALKDRAEQCHLDQFPLQTLEETSGKINYISSVKSSQQENSERLPGEIPSCATSLTPDLGVNEYNSDRGIITQNTSTNVKEWSSAPYGFDQVESNSEFLNPSEASHEKSSDSASKSDPTGEGLIPSEIKSQNDSSVSNVPTSKTESNSPFSAKKQSSVKRFVMKKRLSKSGVLENSVPLNTSDSTRKLETKSENILLSNKIQLNDSGQDMKLGMKETVSANDTREDSGVPCVSSENTVPSELDKTASEQIEVNSSQKTPPVKRFVMKKRISRPRVLGNSETHILASIKSTISHLTCTVKKDGEPHSLSTSKFYKRNNETFENSELDENSDVNSVKCSGNLLPKNTELSRINKKGTFSVPLETAEVSRSGSVCERSDLTKLANEIFSCKESTVDIVLNINSQSKAANLSERLVATPPDFRQRFAAVFHHYGEGDDEQELEEFGSSSSKSGDDSDSTYNPKKGQSNRKKRTVKRNKTD
ncbi:uncharacterized protein [Anabrus simplex]